MMASLPLHIFSPAPTVQLNSVKTFTVGFVHSVLRDGRKKEIGGEAMQTATVYRRLLRAVDKHISKGQHFRDFVSQEFRKNSALADREAARKKLKLASDYTYLMNSVHHHKVKFFVFVLYLLFVVVVGLKLCGYWMFVYLY